jgi:hypothetical protein
MAFETLSKTRFSPRQGAGTRVLAIGAVELPITTPRATSHRGRRASGGKEGDPLVGAEERGRRERTGGTMAGRCIVYSKSCTSFRCVRCAPSGDSAASGAAPSGSESMRSSAAPHGWTWNANSPVTGFFQSYKHHTCQRGPRCESGRNRRSITHHRQRLALHLLPWRQRAQLHLDPIALESQPRRLGVRGAHPHVRV